MERQLLIGGSWCPPVDGERCEVRDPATGEVVGWSAVAGRTDVDRAVGAAVDAAYEWGRSHHDERATVLHRAADLMESRLEDIAFTLTREQGKPLPDSRKEVLLGVEFLRYYAEEGRRVTGSIRPSVRSDVKSLVDYAPVGVVAAIVPWNYPVELYLWKVAPALAAGCTVVAKPPPEAPLAIAAVAEALEEAGLPPGTLADLPAPGTEIGEYLVSHPGVRLITATASTEAGRAIMHAASHDLKRLSLELGGHTPFVVLDDADVEEAAAGALRRSFSNMGQICIAVNRILVAEPVASDFSEALTEASRNLRLGPGIEQGIEYGPMLNESVVARVQQHVNDATTRGSRLLTGGHPPEGKVFSKGSFFLPTVLDQVPAEAQVMNEETYGPVAAIHRADSDAELLEVANSLPYGLAAYIYSGDLERAWAFADHVEAGAVGVNVNDVVELQAPFGGWKLSGLGRELGPEGVQTYLETRHLRMRVRSPYNR